MKGEITMKNIEVELIKSNYYYRGETFIVQFKIEESNSYKTVGVRRNSSYSRENKVIFVRYSKLPLSKEEKLSAAGANRADEIKPIALTEKEIEALNIPEDYNSPKEYQIKILNNSVLFTDEELTTMFLDNPKYNCIISEEDTMSSDTFCSMPKYQGKACKINDKNTSTYNSNICTKEYSEWRDKYFYSYSRYTNSCTHTIQLAKKHPDYDDGLVFYMFKYKISVDKGNVITHNVTLNYMVEHAPGRVSKATRFVRKKPVESTAFEAFNINSQNISWAGNMIWESTDLTWRDFFLNNQKYFEKSGFLALIRNYCEASRQSYYYSSKTSAFLIIFVALLVTYPVFELLIKMGYTKMFFDAYEEMRQKGSKYAIDAYVKKFEELIDNTATKGNAALRFPIYIGEYLKQKSASIDEFFAWRDIYELENMSKENFEKIINSYQFALLNFETGVNQLANVLKYGYKMEKLINFVVKKYLENSDEERNYRTIGGYLSTLRDYLHMCDMLDIKPDMYPNDVNQVHNEVQVLFKAKEASLNDSTFNKIATESEKYIVPTAEELADETSKISKMWDEYTVVFPHSAKSLIEEGMQQHNCVGSYTRHIINGNCIIFFIRKKDEPDKSFITAECTKYGLNQCMYQNNRRVSEENLRTFAASISNKLLRGVRAGHIHALERVAE
jgi:hypothetical protein